jgi:Ca-activated chloride channel homolog
MKTKVDDLLEELYLMDPSLRAAALENGEDILRTTIEELLRSRPEARMDEAFEAELKERLLAEFSRRAKPRRRVPAFLLARPAFRLGLGLAAAASVLVAVYLGFGPRAGAIKPTGDAPPAMIPAATAAGAPGAAAPSIPPRPASPEAELRKAGAGEEEPANRMAERLDESSAAPRSEGARVLAGGSAKKLEAPAQARARDAAQYAAQDGEGAQPAVQPSLQPAAPSPVDRGPKDFNTEGYDAIRESSFAKVLEEPLSTFSIDVDTASYANVRRFLRSGSLPPPDAVRIEELVNYFPYDYEGPRGDEPFAFATELSPCPWEGSHSLLRVALQARRISEAQLPPSNLVFLIDVSGSMEDDNKLPLVKESLKLLVRRLRQEDRISIVVYAGSAGIVLEPTQGSRKDRILKAIDELEAGGSTAGGEGIALAYDLARKSFIATGSNRVILATDGDFNVGASSDGELVRVIEEERRAGVFLTVLGFGMGNYKDSKMQKLADSGNGNYAYVDSLSEADKVLSRQMAGTLFTVAKDVKVQIEFNPARVGAYRLIGYEKRALAARDFADDAKDAGELGAGGSVTALYELEPPSGEASRGDLRYQSTRITGGGAAELMTLKFRYKRPDGDASSLTERPVEIAQRDIASCSADFRFAAAVAEWGLVLRGSAYKGSASIEQAASLARGALGRDPGGYRAEFLELLSLSGKLGDRGR